jgi:hypothetical protein
MGKGLVSKKTHVGTGPNTTLMSYPDTLLSIGLTESTVTRGNVLLFIIKGSSESQRGDLYNEYKVVYYESINGELKIRPI